MKQLYFTALLSIFIITLYGQKSENVFNFTEWVHPDSIQLPSPCELLPLSVAAKAINVDEANITQKFTQGLGDQNSLSCFYKWDDASTKSAGMLLQVLKNGYPEEKDFITRSFLGKFTQGEFVQNLDKKIIYKKFMVGKVAVAYNPVTYASYWHIGNNYMFHLIFNLNSLNEERFLNIIEQIVPETNKNMLVHLLK